MKIGFDLTPIIYHRGVSRYTSNLFQALTKISSAELFGYASSSRGFAQLQLDLQLLAQNLSQEQQKIFWQNLVCQKIPPKLSEIYWHYLSFNPLKKKLKNIDIFHSCDYLQPPDKNLPLVSTIHDLAILKYPAIANPEILRHHQKSWSILKKRNAHIIAVSQATQNDVINLLGFSPDHVHLVYEALPAENLLNQKELSQQDISVIRRKFSLSHLPYFLFVGTREPRKNLDRLIQAWWPFRERSQLVLVGAPGWNEPQYQHQNLKVLPAVNNQDLGFLYHFAQALTFPSLDEGFGLPILEAFYYQTPVITSKNTATEEVAGEAAILVNPLYLIDLQAALEQALNFTDKDRKIWRAKMQIQLAKFSWDTAAAQTYQVYQQAVKDFHHA